MGDPDPRRSSRTRPTQSQSQAPSSSSSVSGRAERSSRSSTNKISSPQPTASTSTSSEPPDDANGDALPRTLRSTRTRDANPITNRDKSATAVEGEESMASSDNEIQDDDESVRCICGFDDYPGPPTVKDDHKHPFKDAPDLEPFLAADVPDDVAGFFLQCDVCKVWQHGGCVGILNADSSPDEYFCEQCRKDYHKISVAGSGQRYSVYLPVNRQSRSNSRQTASKEKEKEPPKSPKGRESKSSRAAAALASSKRRSTLNSRHVYDEEEELRRAIEASKEEAGTGEQPEGSVRRTKRGRSDSEEKTEGTKRQRTGSKSPPPSEDTAAAQEDSDDAPMRNGASKSKPRNASARNAQRDIQKTEKEEREKQKAEAANKRKSRAERRRADDSDPSEEMPLAVRAAVRSQGPVAEIPPPPPRATSPQPTTESKPEKSSSKSKKSGSRKKGRNQYTKDRERSPGRSQSRDVPDNGNGGPSGNGNNPRSRNARTHAKQEKDKDMSWNDMERRIAYWTDFTQRVEQDLNIDREALDKAKKSVVANKELDSEHKTDLADGNTSSTTVTMALAAAMGANGSTGSSNGGSPLKNLVEGPVNSTGAPPIIAITNGDSPMADTVDGERKNEGSMNVQERLEFIKGQIKSWHSIYGVDTRS